MLLKCLEWYSSGHRKVSTPFPLNVRLSFNGTGTFLREFFTSWQKGGFLCTPGSPPRSFTDIRDTISVSLT